MSDFMVYEEALITLSLYCPLIPRDKTKPPEAKNTTITNKASVFPAIKFLLVAPINRKYAEANCFIRNKRRNCLNNLP